MRGEVGWLVFLVLAKWVLIVLVLLGLDCEEMEAQCEWDLEKEMDEEQMKTMKWFELDVVAVEFVEFEVEIGLWVCQRDRECLLSFQSGHAIEACGA